METFDILEQKIKKTIELVEKITNENTALAGENIQYRKELRKLEQRLSNIENSERARADTIKTKLNSIVNKLGILEQV